jgi:predicted ferric reductase
LTVDYILDKSGRFNDKAFFLCGPKALKESLTKKLLSIGVSLDKINVEEFDFR